MTLIIYLSDFAMANAHFVAKFHKVLKTINFCVSWTRPRVLTLAMLMTMTMFESIYENDINIFMTI
jgi:hypothetical protein